jgi:hypothetical protein
MIFWLNYCFVYVAFLMVNDILTEQGRTILLLYIYYIDISTVKSVLRGHLWDKEKVIQ